jgi:hypothetical protein
MLFPNSQSFGGRESDSDGFDDLKGCPVDLTDILDTEESKT